MMIEPLYDFSLTAEQEARARTLHESSIILDMLFQGPVGTYSLPEGAEEELLALAQEACPGDEIAQCNWATAEILRRMIGGSYSQLYKDCWYDSGLTGGCRQLSVTDRDEALRSAVELQAEFDTYPWLVKCTSVEQIRRCKKEGLKAGIVTSQEAEGYSKDLKLLELLYNYGLRVQQLSYNNQNLIGAGCMEPNGGAGLSKFGIRFVEKCNELGIVVDTGHCGYHTTMDACKYSKAPVIASHTGVEKVNFHARCKSDDEIRAIADTGGVGGIFAMPWFTGADPENTTVDDFIDHIDYVVRLVGIDHVGIGTDWPMPQTKWAAITFKKYVAPTIGFAPGNGPSTEWIHGLTVLAGCSGSTKPADTTPAADSSTAAAETESAAPSASAITVVLSDVGNNMDPSVANAINTFTIMSHVYDNLLNCNLDFSLQPGVIASWEQPDELTYKLTVGDGFMFQNGEPLEVEDVVYSLTRLENVSQTADLYAQIDSVSAEGNVVTIVLKEANSGFIRDLVEVPVLNKSYCEEAGDAYANAPIGTGPYVMSEFVPGEKAVLTAWADYPGQKASIETITFKAIAEPSAAYIAVEAGDADFTEIDATDYARAEANDNLVFYTGDTTYTAFVAMHTQEPPFDNVNVRKAMAYAYNKEGYLNVKGENYHTIDSMFPMMSEYYYASDDAITYDLEKAKELLAAEGYDESNPLTFEIIGYSNNDVVMQAYQADLKSIGVNVELVTQEFGVFLENMVGMNFQMLTGGWGDTTGNPLTSAECYYSGSFGSQNISFYDNPVCDELYITAKTSNDTAEIKDACQQIQQIAWEDVPMFPTFGRNEGYVYNKNLNGVVISPSGTLSFRTATLG